MVNIPNNLSMGQAVLVARALGCDVDEPSEVGGKGFVTHPKWPDAIPFRYGPSGLTGDRKRLIARLAVLTHKAAKGEDE